MKNIKHSKRAAIVSPKKRTLESVMAKKFESIVLTEDVVVNDGDWMLHAGDTIHVSKAAAKPLAKRVKESDDKEDKDEGDAIDVTDSLALDDEDDLGEPLDNDGEDDDSEGEGGESDDEDDDDGSDDDDEDDLSDLDDDDDDSDEDGEDEAIDLLTSPSKKEEAKAKPGKPAEKPVVKTPAPKKK